LFEAGYIGSELEGARIGNLVLIKGGVSIFDLRLLKSMWQFMGDLLSQQEAAGIVNVKERQRIQASKKKELDSIAQIVSTLPHSIQGTFLTEDHEAWFTLEPIHMRINPEDIVFKHGCDLEGEWHMLGIVDALPDDGTLNIDAFTRVSTQVEAGLRVMLLGLRTALGRPSQRYGITPIIIFRTMKKAA
jgi:hypothetical protein